MKKIKVGCARPLVGRYIEYTLDVSDDADKEEILESVKEWALSQFNWWHEEIETAS